MQDFASYANQAGWVSVAQMPLIIALAGKNNLVSCKSPLCSSVTFAQY